MPYREFHYRWEFDLESSPEQLWPLVADTNRFNRDTGVPAVQMVQSEGKGLKNARRRLRPAARRGCPGGPLRFHLVRAQGRGIPRRSAVRLYSVVGHQPRRLLYRAAR